MKLGKVLTGFGKIPAGSDANSLWHVFQADSKPVLVMAGAWWGGDTLESAALYIGPPGPSVANGTQSPADYGGDERNTITVHGTGAMSGGEFTNTNKGQMFGNRNITLPFIVPPNWVVLATSTSANTNAWKMVLQGFEIEG